MKVLVTAGGTEEPIDGVRSLTNFSTGATGGALASYLAEHGAEVLLLHAARARFGGFDGDCDAFVTFTDLQRLLEHHLATADWDAIIHVAAVGDYSVASLEVDGHASVLPVEGKIGSGSDVVIRLSANPKLIDSLRQWSRNPATCVVGFKLTDNPDPAARETQVRSMLERGVADLVVHNDVREIDDQRHVATIHNRRGPIVRTETKQRLARELWSQLTIGGAS